MPGLVSWTHASEKIAIPTREPRMRINTNRGDTPKRRTRHIPLLLATLALLATLGVAACGGTASTSSTAAASSNGGRSIISLADSSQPTQAETLANVTEKITSPAETVVEKVCTSVVNVRVSGVTASPFYGEQQYEGVGSGIVYTSDGYILTNDHVVTMNGKPASSVVVTLATGEELPATIVARDSAKDIALLKVDKTGLTPVVFAASSDVKVGQWAFAIGSPFDYSNSVTEGIVSGLDRDLSTGDSTTGDLTGLLQTDAAISPGNSGGGLFNADGELIGMPEAYISSQSGAENLGFAIPADTVAAVAERLMNK
jgi:serine protease Do